MAIQGTQNIKNTLEKEEQGTSLVVQWVRLHALNAGDLDSIPGQGTRSHMYAATKSSNATTEDPARRN